ncbi:hypothetical protein BX600DRAFT_215459 [Xylariales sp. PMI_506]|nr:hypothetical protein BX600DRAFT_215459 [Xylariales sp. PMI_506]
MKKHHAILKSLSRPLSATTRLSSVKPSHSRSRTPQPTLYKSGFEKAVLSPDLFPTTVRSALATFRAPQRNSNRFPRLHFYLATHTEPDKPSPDPSRVVRGPRTSMLHWIQLVTTPTADTTGTCLLLHFDNHRYVFGNISEGTQRAMVQRKIALAKAESIFMTGPVNWHNAGGLIGMILTLADSISTQKEAIKAHNEERQKQGKAGVQDNTPSNLKLYGGKNLAHLLATARRFVFRKGFPLQPNEIRNDPRALNGGSSEPDWADSNIKVWYMPVESAAARPLKSPRKRSHEEMTGAAPLNLDAASSPSVEDENHKLVQSVVMQMFNSNWKLDALVETPLHEAQLPAKLFVRDEKGHIQVYKGPLPGEAENVPNIPVLVRRPWPAALIRELPKTEPSRQSMCYLVKAYDRRGKFNPKEAEKYGVAKTDYRKLTAGESVTGKDGVIVTPEMVLGETLPGQGYAILDIPDATYIEPLLDRPELANENIMKNIVVVYWLLGPNVIHDARLQAFMQKTNSLRHIVCSGDTAPNMIALESVATQAYKLHCIDPDRFPLPKYSNILSLSKTETSSLPNMFEVGRTGKTVQLAPQYIHQDDKIVSFPDLQKLAASDHKPDVESLAEEAKQKIIDPAFLSRIEAMEFDIPCRDAEIISLGTGSALPSKYRNVSATLVRVPGVGNYLFDAGENTLGQIRRVFGDDTSAVLRDLKAIWISHLHADHHLGTAAVIREWHAETRESNAAATLHLASHTHFIDWLREYAEIEDYGYSRLTFSEFSYSDRTTRICRPKVFRPAEVEAVGLERIDACYVEHCHGALATVFTWPSGLKIAYSGDCRPSDSFVRIGQGATLLIHESTFDDELKGDAIAKKHSTMSEAIDVGRRMGARRILLTHFSQRYQKVPTMEDSMDSNRDANRDGKAKTDEVILVAFDYMRVKLGDFRKAQAFLPAMQKLFEDVTDQ